MNELIQIKQAKRALDALDRLNLCLKNFSLDWHFYEDVEFDKITFKWQEVKGRLENIKGLSTIKFPKGTEKLDFGHSKLYKLAETPANENRFLYEVNVPLIFGPHVHDNLKETIIPLDEPIIMFVKENGNWQEHLVEIGQSFSVKSGVTHACIFEHKGKCEIHWK